MNAAQILRAASICEGLEAKTIVDLIEIGSEGAVLRVPGLGARYLIARDGTARREIALTSRRAEDSHANDGDAS